MGSIFMNLILLGTVSLLSITGLQFSHPDHISEEIEIWIDWHKIIRIIAAFSCFLMWIKVFYWMRLHKNYAMYVKLILVTIENSRYFLFLVLIIMIAFSSFYLVMN